jgi:hypothetical protein
MTGAVPGARLGRVCGAEYVGRLRGQITWAEYVGRVCGQWMVGGIRSAATIKEAAVDGVNGR